MTPEQTDLATRLRAHPRFDDSIRTGMLVRWVQVGPGHEVRAPVLDDDATSGVLLAMVTTLYPSTFVAFEPDEFHAAESPLRVAVTCYGPGEAAGGHQSSGATLGEACARALLALWGEP